MNAKPRQIFSCFVIGGTETAIKCSSMILSRGHLVLGAFPLSQDFRNWAEANQIRCIDSLAGFEKFLKVQQFEYLFSLENEIILPESILNLPTKYSVNYHDGPLPRYAGINTVPWALVRGEKTYGIAWHIVKPKIDVGDIVKNSIFDVAPMETSQSLYIKCAMYGIAVFSELIDDLERNELKFVPQHLAERNYCALKDRLPCNGIIDWASGANVIDRLIRATSFGPLRNDIGLASVLANDNLFYVGQLQVMKTSSGKKPGEVLQISRNGILVSTSDCDVIISELRDLTGSRLLSQNLESQYGIRVGYQFELPVPSVLKSLEQLVEIRCRHQYFWAREWSKVSKTRLPLFSKVNNYEMDGRQSRIDTPKVEVEKGLLAELQIRFGQEFPVSHIVCAAYLICLRRLLESDQVSVGIATPKGGISDFSPLSDLFIARVQPLTTEAEDQLDIRNNVERIVSKLKYTLYHIGYTRDLALRFPEIKDKAEMAGSTDPFPIVVDFLESSTNDNETINQKREVTLQIAPNGTFSFRLFIESSNAIMVSECLEVFELLARNIVTFLETAAKGQSQLLGAVKLASSNVLEKKKNQMKKAA